MTAVEKIDWFCPKCNSYVSSESVTFEETHQICNTGVILKELNQNKMTAEIEKPTEKQLKYIESIEDNTGIIFTGKTKKEASQYIDANKNHPSNQNEWAIINGY